MTTTTEHELNQMGLRDLQRRFHEVVGEETRCPNRVFLIRRILSATTSGASISETETAPSIDDQPTEATASEPTTSSSDLAADVSSLDDPLLVDSPAPDPNAQGPNTPVDVDTPANEEELSTVPEASPSNEDTARGATDIEVEDAAASAVIEPAPNDETTPPVLALAEDEAIDDSKVGAVATEASVITRDALASTAPPAPRAPSARTEEQPRSPRGRFRDMTVAQLQSLYVATVGRSTGSTDRRYLEWKIREAEKGRIPVGPREARSPETPDADTARVLPLRLETEAVEAMDATWKSHGMKSRMEFFRRALGHYLAHLGAHGAAMHFTSQAPIG